MIALNNIFNRKSIVPVQNIYFLKLIVHSFFFQRGIVSHIKSSTQKSNALIQK